MDDDPQAGDGLISGGQFRGDIEGPIPRLAEADPAGAFHLKSRAAVGGGDFDHLDRVGFEAVAAGGLPGALAGFPGGEQGRVRSREGLLQRGDFLTKRGLLVGAQDRPRHDGGPGIYPRIAVEPLV